MKPSRAVPLAAALGVVAYLFASVPASFARRAATGQRLDAPPTRATAEDTAAPREEPTREPAEAPGRERGERGEKEPGEKVVEPAPEVPPAPGRSRSGERDSTPPAAEVPEPPVPRVHRTCDFREPAWIWCDDFEERRLGSYFEYDDADGSFVRERGVGVGGSWGMRATFREGQVDAGSLKLAFGLTPQSYMTPVDAGTRRYRDVYWRFYLRRDPGWRGGGGDKLTRATSFVSPGSWAQSMVAHVWSGAPPWEHHLVADPASGTDPVTGVVLTGRYNDFANLTWLGAARGPTLLFDSEYAGRWACIEAHARLNEPGAGDGIFEVWVDGSLETRATDLNWVGTFVEYGINAVFLENWWNDGSPARQSRYLDDFVVSTRRIGCELPGD